MGALLRARRLGLTLAVIACVGVDAADMCTVGKRQSPVDLPVSESPPGRTALQITWAVQDAEVVNTGSTLRVVPSQGDVPGGMAFTSGWADKRYTLLGCEFYYNSLHTVGGIQFPLEAICMHHKDGSNGLFGALTILFRLGSTENPFLEQFGEYPPPGSTSEEKAVAQVSVDSTGSSGELTVVRRLSTEQDVDFQSLLTGMDLTRFYSYRGSGVVSPCTENVDWYVLMGAAPLARHQLDSIIAAAPSGGNFRVPQPFNSYHRTLYGCPKVHERRPLYPYDAENWVAYTEQTTDNPTRICLSGSEQSPINLPACTPAVQPEIKLTWKPQSATRTLGELGVVIQPVDGEPGGIEIDGVLHVLEECRIHMGAEHTVGNIQYAAEVQCAHAGAFQGRHAVLAQLFEVQADAPPNAFLQAVMDAGNAPFELNFEELVPTNADLRKYWSYAGSESLPPCAEDRDWYVLQTAAPIPASQHEQLQAWAARSGLPERLFRPPQRVGSRVVAGCSGETFEDQVVGNLQRLGGEVDEATTLATQLDGWITFLFVMITISIFGLARRVYLSFLEHKAQFA